MLGALGSLTILDKLKSGFGSPGDHVTVGGKGRGLLQEGNRCGVAHLPDGHQRLSFD